MGKQTGCYANSIVANPNRPTVSHPAHVTQLFLSAITSHLFGGQGLAFLRDVETHVRFSIAIPALVIAELVVHQGILSALKLFVERGIVASEDTPKFHAAINAATRMRNSIRLELGLLVLAYTVETIFTLTNQARSRELASMSSMLRVPWWVVDESME